MQEIFTREEFYKLVWRKSLKEIALEYDLSETKLKAISSEFDIPLPDKNYWQECDKNKIIEQTPLPRRPIAGEQEIYLKGSPKHYYYWDTNDEQALYCTIPPNPQFDYEIEEIRPVILAQVRENIIPQSLHSPHPKIKQLLDADKLRADEYKKKRNAFDWAEPERFNEPGQRRRLRIINSIFKTIERLNHTIEKIDDRGNGIAIIVYGKAITLEVVEMQHRGKAIPFLADEPEVTKIKISITGEKIPWGCSKEWRDEPKKQIANRLDEIITDIILTSEKIYRTSKIRCWEDDVRAIHKIRDAHRKRLEKEEKERVERLIIQSSNHIKAREIREYVSSVVVSAKLKDESFNADTWSKWALRVADEIDPIRSERYKEIIPTK